MITEMFDNKRKHNARKGLTRPGKDYKDVGNITKTCEILQRCEKD